MLGNLWEYMDTPQAFGPFHLIFFAFFILLEVLLVVFFRKCNDKTFRKIVFICWIIIVIFEIFKQIYWNFELKQTIVGESVRYNIGARSGKYEWSSFPYQFCSLPLYLWPLLVFLPDSKFRDIMNIFIATFVFFAGFGYFFVPASLYSSTFISHQTLIHHGLQWSICLFIFIHEFDKFTYKKFLWSSLWLVGTVALAVILNVIFSNFGSLNLFELNPIQPTSAALFGDILKAVGYPLYLLIYLVGFFVFANVAYFAIYYIIVLCRFLKGKIKGNTPKAA